MIMSGLERLDLFWFSLNYIPTFPLAYAGPAGCPAGIPGEGDGGPAQADGDHQRNTEPAALPHAEGKGRVQPGAGRAAWKRPAR